MKPVRGVGLWLIAFVWAYALWLLHDDSAKLPELLAGIPVAALAATGTDLVRRQRVAPMRFRLRWLLGAWRLIPAAIRDCFVLTKLALAQLVRREPVRGRTVALGFDFGGEHPDANGRRAIALGLGSFAPGTLVIGVDPDKNLLIAHQLGATPEPSNLDPLDLG